MPENQPAILRSEDHSADIEQEGFAELLSQISADLELGKRIDWNRLEQEHAHYANDLNDIRPAMEALQNLKFKKAFTGQVSDDHPNFSSNEESRTLGDFRIVREIGRGGMGVVYEAQQLSIDRLVALKILPLAELIDERALARFKNEVAAIATLDHPHIVSVYAIGEQRGVHYFAMQLIHGQSLAAVIRELRARCSNNESITGKMIDQVVSQIQDQGIDASDESIDESSKDSNRNDQAETVDETRARAGTETSKITDRNYFRNIVRMVIHAAEALDHAHECGIVHRDIKPANLLLNKKGKLYITDFGVARIDAGAGVTMTGDFIGTLRYMSPEQVLAGQAIVDHRTDIYSLGATLYELLALQSVWPGEDRTDLIRKISFEEPIRPQKINPAIPTDLETIVLKSLTKNPNERYASAQALANDLQRFLDDKPVVAKRPTLIQHVSKWTRRNPVIMWSAVLVMTIAAITSTVSAVLISNEREKSEQRLAQLTKGNEIITSIFMDLDIDKVKDGPDPLEAVLAKRLVKAGKQIDGESVGDALVVAGMQDRLGSSLLSLGFYEDATELLQTCLDTRSELLDPDDPIVIASMSNLALAFLLADRLNEALPLAEKAHDLYVEMPEPDDPKLHSVMNNLALAYQSDGQLDKAILILEHELAWSQSTLEPDDPDLLANMSNLANMYGDAGQMDRAIVMHEKSLEISKDVLGPKHPDTIMSMNNLAATYDQDGQLDRAIALWEKTLDLYKTELGPSHRYTFYTTCSLATAYQSAGRHEDALTLLELAVELSTAELGPENPDTISCTVDLAKAYGRVDRFDDALPLLVSAMEMKKVLFGLSDPTTLKGMNEVAVMYQRVGRLDDALVLIEETLKLGMAELGPDHRQTLKFMNSHAYLHNIAGLRDIAIPMHEKTLKLRQEKFGLSDRDSLQSLNNLAMTYKADGQLDRALPLLEQTVELREARFGRDDPSTIESMRRLAVAYRSNRQPDKALLLQEEILEWKAANLGLDDDDTLKTMRTLAKLHVESGQAEDALPILKARQKLLSKKHGPDHQLTRDSLAELGVTYNWAGQLNVSLKLLEEARNSSEKERFVVRYGMELVDVFVKTGQPDLATELANDVLEIIRAKLPADSTELARQLSMLGRVYGLPAKSYSDAERYLHDSLAICEKETPDKWQTFDTQSLLGAALLGQEKFGQAESHLLTGHEGLVEREDSIPAVRADCVVNSAQRLVEFYETWNAADPSEERSAKAKEWHLRLEQLEAR